MRSSRSRINCCSALATGGHFLLAAWLNPREFPTWGPILRASPPRAERGSAIGVAREAPEALVSNLVGQHVRPSWTKSGGYLTASDRNCLSLRGN
ncbi:hypothetical protein GCM10010508_62560 [Streptomyces naganishii JCM 4654]|uniref:Uncharacterized protein n=1 Tax=Streptomyces naganishii JCM 4654 TaxID=1306179 RepID=A0A919CYH7_9ACTN|nr:hypothetical protein GCM10010508_62560 [Streptomyces naganishii JCM 4654]